MIPLPGHLGSRVIDASVCLGELTAWPNAGGDLLVSVCVCVCERERERESESERERERELGSFEEWREKEGRTQVMG